jgi:hypothetical protein
MTTALWLLAIQGIIGAFDTLYYHEWRAHLPVGGPGTAPELKLHAAPEPLRWGLTVMAIGVFLSGARDLYAALGLPHGGWPWSAEKAEGRS